MWLWLLACARADPTLTWWAHDPAQAEAIEAALEAAWPSAPVAVVVATPPPGTDGLHLDADGLWLVQGDETRQHTGALDPTAAAAMARSWARSLPEAPLPPTPPLPAPAPAPEPAPVPDEWPAWSFVAGPATRRPNPGPAFHFVFQARLPHLSADFSFDPAERVRYMDDTQEQGGLIVRRLGVTASLHRDWPLEQGWVLEAGAGVGVRNHFYSDIVRPDVSAALLLPTATARLRLWSPLEEPAVRLGGGLMVGADGLNTDLRYDTEHGGRVRPLTVAVEFGVRSH